jgi:hypothetical protein
MENLCRIIRHLQRRRASETKNRRAPQRHSGYPARSPAVNQKVKDESLFGWFENFVPLFP